MIRPQGEQEERMSQVSPYLDVQLVTNSTEYGNEIINKYLPPNRNGFFFRLKSPEHIMPKNESREHDSRRFLVLCDDLTNADVVKCVHLAQKRQLSIAILLLHPEQETRLLPLGARIFYPSQLMEHMAEVKQMPRRQREEPRFPVWLLSVLVICCLVWCLRN